MQKRPLSAGKDGPARQAASRKWLQIDAQGKMAYVTVDKHTLVLRLNIPYRDLRSLEYSVRTPLLKIMERGSQAQALASGWQTAVTPLLHICVRVPKGHNEQLGSIAHQQQEQLRLLLLFTFSLRTNLAHAFIAACLLVLHRCQLMLVFDLTRQGAGHQRVPGWHPGAREGVRHQPGVCQNDRHTGPGATQALPPIFGPMCFEKLIVFLAFSCTSP